MGQWNEQNFFDCETYKKGKNQSQDFMPTNFRTELSKTQFFPLNLVNVLEINFIKMNKVFVIATARLVMKT